MKRSHAQKWRDNIWLIGFQICGGSFFWKPHLASGASSPDSFDDISQGLRGCWPWVWNSSEPSRPGVSPAPPTPTKLRPPTALASGWEDKVVGFETKYTAISFLTPVTISTTLTLSRAYSQLCRTSCLFVLLLALKRTPSSSSRLL